ncbi:MAG: TOTE conflict system archaeo-eukaryotic primase domain-containing protein [Acidimicrobiales bacterium]
MVDELASALAEVEALRAENERLRGLLGLTGEREAEPPAAWEPTLFASVAAPRPAVDRRSSPAEKVGLFRSLLAGRDDVYALRWQNDRSGKSGWSPAVVGGWANSKRPDREYEPFTDAVIERHLAGDVSAGLYPLLHNDRCRLLACDFDGGSWALDALAYLDACRQAGLPAVLERSRSGDGGHVWVFSGPVPAADARKVGAAMLRRAMASRVEIDLSSYDRLFPSQDVMPKGSFGNLIALPLQGGCRKLGTTLFIDPTTLEPYEDQWAFLSAVPFASPEALTAIAESVRPLPVGAEAVDWEQARDRHPAPPVVHATLAGMLSIGRIGLPPWLISQLKHLASLHNRKFYENERLRLSNHATPRLIRCYVEELDRLGLPRGLLDAARCVIESAGSRFDLDDQRNEPAAIDVAPTIDLSPHQQMAVDKLLDHDHAVLVAPTGAGKTVMACAVIAAHRVPTLILVDRTPLVEQWKSRLMEHLGLGRRQIGRVAAPAKPSGIIDIATLQAVARRSGASALFEGYGLVIVDECHHLPARSFEIAVRDARCRRWLGLTATPYRRDGLEAIITMQCGPVRHEIALAETAAAALTRRLHVHDTQSTAGTGEIAAIQDVFRALVSDEARTRQIAADVALAVRDGRNVLVLTQWTDHLDALAVELQQRGVEPLVLKGGLGKRARAAVIDRLNADPAPTGQLLLATGSYLGEGFDSPSLDTLFLAFPLAFKGRVVQYIGRILRANDIKVDVEVHDYLDPGPVFRKMHAKRLATYSTLGFDVPSRRCRSQ